MQQETLPKTPNINGLIGQFMDLQEEWEARPADFAWPSLEALAGQAALAYNEGMGPSFHALVLDGIEHGEFHERFLHYLLQAGFDPFRLLGLDDAHSAAPPISHASLAASARNNAASARMRQMLMDQARTRFAPLLQGPGADDVAHAVLREMALASQDSLPGEILALLPGTTN